MKEFNNEKLRERVIAYRKKYATPYKCIGVEMGLEYDVAKYLISRFMRGIINLNDETQAMLNEYLTKHGF